MKVRKLRIAWSVGWGIVAVLLIALWARSYWRWDAITLPVVSNCGISLKSFEGRIDVKKTAITNAKLWPVGVESFNYDNHEVVLMEKYHVQNYTGPLVAKSAKIVALSHLSLIVTASLLAAAPWIRWSNRFSLRTLLIATTLVAVGLWVIVWASR